MPANPQLAPRWNMGLHLFELLRLNDLFLGPKRGSIKSPQVVKAIPRYHDSSFEVWDKDGRRFLVQVIEIPQEK